MKSLLTAFALVALAALGSAQQVGRIQRGDAIRSPSSHTPPPITNPEPMTLVALAGGAAIAGGLLRRRQQREKA